MKAPPISPAAVPDPIGKTLSRTFQAIPDPGQKLSKNPKEIRVDPDQCRPHRPALSWKQLPIAKGFNTAMHVKTQRSETVAPDIRPIVCNDVTPMIRQQAFSAGSRLSFAGLRPGTIATLAVGATRVESILDDGRRQVLGFTFRGEQLNHPPPVIEFRQIALTAGVFYLVNESDLNRCGNCQYDSSRSPGGGLNGQLQRMTAQTILLGCCSAKERIAAFLADMAGRIGTPGKTGTVIELPMKREDIADYLGLNAETVSRLFSKLKKCGVIDLPKPGRVILHDQNALMALSPLTRGGTASRSDAA